MSCVIEYKNSAAAPSYGSSNKLSKMNIVLHIILIVLTKFLNH